MIIKSTICSQPVHVLVIEYPKDKTHIGPEQQQRCTHAKHGKANIASHRLKNRALWRRVSNTCPHHIRLPSLIARSLSAYQTRSDLDLLLCQFFFLFFAIFVSLWISRVHRVFVSLKKGLGSYVLRFLFPLINRIQKL